MRPALTLDLPGLTLLRPVGSGSFGEVWLARTVTGQFRAVKIVWLRRSGEACAEASLQELGDRVFRGVQEYVRRIPPGSSAGLAVLHVDRDPGGRFFYYVMELADDATTGREIDPERYEPLTLGELRRRAPGGAVSADETIRLGVKLAEGLAALHHAGLVHRDIKPSNIVFIGGEPRLADIDLVRPREASLSLGGTLGYAPPESPGRPPADVFSLGRTLYVTVTGLPAGEFPRLPDDWDQRPDADGLRRLNNVLLRAGDRDPAKRHQDGAALRDELLLVAAGEDPERWRWLKRAARGATIIAGIAVPVAIAALLVAWELRQKEAAKTLALYQAGLSEAAKTFALYQAGLSEAASNLERLSLGNARRALARATDYNTTPGIELELLRRQADGDPPFRLLKVGSSVDQLAFSSDGALLAAATSSNEFQVFSLPEGRLRAVVTTVALLAGFLSPGNELVGTHREDTNRPVRVWDPHTGHLLPHRLPGNWVPAGILGDGQTLVALAYSSPGRLIRWQPLSGTEGGLETWHPSLPLDDAGYPLHLAAVDATGRRLFFRQNLGAEDTYHSLLYWTEPGSPPPAPWSLPGRNVNTIALSPDGRRAAFTEVNTGGLVVGRFAGGFLPSRTNYQPEIRALAFSPRGEQLASGGTEARIRFQDADTLETTHSLTGHGSSITALAWSTDGGLLASGDQEGEVRVWRTAAPAPEARVVWTGFKIGGGPVQIVASDDETLVAATAGTHVVALLDGATLKERRRLEGLVIPLGFADGTNQLWALAPGGRLARVGLRDGRILKQTDAFDGSVDSAFGQVSPDGQRLLLYSGNRVTIWALDTVEPRRLSASAPVSGTILDLAFSDDSRQALTVGREGSVVLWDLATGAAQPLVGLTDQNIHTACFLPHSTECVLGTDSDRLLRLDTARPDRLKTLAGSLPANYQLVAEPGGDRLFAAGVNGRLGVIRTTDGQPLVWFTHRGLAAEPGEHTLKRLLYLPRQRQLLSLTEDGRLARW